MTTVNEYLEEHPDDEDNECRHGFPKPEWCPICSKEDEGCDKYHALKNDGKLTGYYNNPDEADSMYDEEIEPPLGQEWGR